MADVWSLRDLVFRLSKVDAERAWSCERRIIHRYPASNKQCEKSWDRWEPGILRSRRRPIEIFRDWGYKVPPVPPPDTAKKGSQRQIPQHIQLPFFFPLDSRRHEGRWKKESRLEQSTTIILLKNPTRRLADASSSNSSTMMSGRYSIVNIIADN